MDRSRRLVAVLLAALVVGGACTGSKSKKASAPATTSQSAGPKAISDADAVKAAEKWLDDWKELDQPTRQALKLSKVVHTPKVAHVHFNQVYADHAVRGAEVIVNVLDNGTVQSVGNSVAKVQPPAAVDAKVDEAKAKSVASKAVTEHVDGDPNAKIVWLQDGNRLRLGWSVNISTTDKNKRGAWTVWVDAVTGAVADAREYSLSEAPAAAAAALPVSPIVAPDAVTASGSRCDLKDQPAACVFRVDPIYSDGGRVPSVSEANRFLSAQPLQGLKDPKSGALVGDFVNLEPAGVQPVRRPNSKWDVGRGDPGFEAAMAYFWIDHTQRVIQRLGFSNVRNEPFPVEALDPEVSNNSFFDPNKQQIFLGVDDNSINEGEDASGIIHEYGHAVLDQQANGFRNNPEQAAYHEAFGDLLAVLSTLEFRDGDVACMFPWPTGGKCLRRIDTTARYPDDLKNEEHDDSAIPSSAVFEVLTNLLGKDGINVADCARGKDCGPVRDRVLTTLLAANASLPPTATLPDIAAAFEQTNQAVFGGQDADLIAKAFADHGLDQAGSATVDANGQAGTNSKVAVDIAVAHPSRGELGLQIGVVDKNFNDLCQPITLVRPNSSDTGADLAGRVDVSDTPCAKFVPPSADQQWFLFAEDGKKGNVGRIDTFRVIQDGVPFLATGVPQPIADNDPDGSAVLINASGTDVPQQGQEGIEQGATAGTTASTPTATIAISHSHIGDLSVRAGVADANGNVLCSVPILDPDPADSSPGAKGDVDLGKCAKLYPPTNGHQWFLEVIDTAGGDTGTVDEFTVTGPDGQHRSSGAPAKIPDDDEGGTVLFIAS